MSHRPRLLSDNGPSYITGDLADWLARQQIEHIRGAPCHPQTQAKIERRHQALRSRILLEHCYLGCLASSGQEIGRTQPWLPKMAGSRLQATQLQASGL